ncbi:hypothetical protein Rhopal_003884-T1 [Rhodotorula paludigena]|uniref:Major facilitator superfamily (MFS) profile domain-containing protein n=1 Tax=Rhodotorula paludigena TaxID=86838 RepID=A0AAV5GMX5_9BASI|nr:hypothetical protein Rhopal_003884-T1 [Rhodotorula paludigena]
MQPVWGRLSDIFGRKYTLITCLVIFTIASLACALAQSMLQLIVFRGAQGFGGGGLMNLVMIIISDIVSLKERGKYQAITEMTIIVGNGVGPVIGAVFLPLKKVRGSMLEKLQQIDYGVFFLWEWKIARIPVVPRHGILIIPQLVTSTLFVGISGLIVSRTGEYKPSICLGYAMWAIGLALISTLDDKSSTARIVGYQLFSGAGQGQTLQTSMVAVQAAVPRSEINTILRSKLNARGFAESTIFTIIDDPTSIWASASVTGTASLDSLDPARKEQIISAYVAGFQTLFRVLVALIGFDFVITLLLVERHSLQKDDEAALKERGKAWVERRKAKRRGGRAHKVDPQAAPGNQAEEEGKGDKQRQHGHDKIQGQQAV